MLPLLTILIVSLLFILMYLLSGQTIDKRKPNLEPLLAKSFDLSTISFNSADLSIEPQLEKISGLPEKMQPPKEVILPVKVVPPKKSIQPSSDPEKIVDEESADGADLAELKSASVEDLQVKVVKPKAVEKNKPLLKPVEKAKPKPVKVVKKKKPLKKVVKAIKRHSSKVVAKTSGKKSNVNAVRSNDGALSDTSSQVVSHVRNSKPVQRIPPVYPRRARRRNIEGEVIIHFLVTRSGDVDGKTLRITHAKPANVFNKSVLKAVSKWKFSPGSMPYTTSQRLVFSLKR